MAIKKKRKVTQRQLTTREPDRMMVRLPDGVLQRVDRWNAAFAERHGIEPLSRSAAIGALLKKGLDAGERELAKR